MSDLAANHWKLLRQMAGTTFPESYFKYEHLDNIDRITVTMLQDPDPDADGPKTVVERNESWVNVLPRIKLMETRIFGTPQRSG